VGHYDSRLGLPLEAAAGPAEAEDEAPAVVSGGGNEPPCFLDGANRKMAKYYAALWRVSRRTSNLPDFIPSTTVDAEGEMEARALALDVFKNRGVPLGLDTRLYVKLSADDGDTDEQDMPDDGSTQSSVEDVVHWANRKGKQFVIDNRLEWLLTFA
jgi:hypothetical protein